MNTKKVVLLLGLVVILIAGLGVFLHYGFVQQASLPKPPSRPFAVRRYLEAQLPHPWKIKITGTPGTPVVVGYRVDGWHSSIIRGVVPTNFTVNARRKVELAIKNAGSTKAQIGFTASNFSRGASACEPYFGLSGGVSEDVGFNYSSFGSLPERELTPLDWPMTLPPGMTKRVTEAHDFFRDRAEVELKEHLEKLAKNPQDHSLQAGLGHLYFKTKNRPAAESAFEKFFHSDCKDPTFMNGQLWTYVDTYGGTNLALAREVGEKMILLAPQDPYLADTVGWILFKLGEYETAIPLLKIGQGANQSGPTVRYHLGMAYYMSMREEDARKLLRDFHSGWAGEVDFAEVKKCLEVMNIDPQKATRREVATLKGRLAEKKDDPVAADRLARIYETGGCVRNQLQADPLLLQAVLIQSYRLTTNGALGWYPRISPAVQIIEKPVPPQEPELTRIVNDGRDGLFHPMTNTVVDMSGHADGIYRFVSVDIPTNVTVTFTSNSNHKPVLWLVDSNCSIHGTVDVSRLMRRNAGRAFGESGSSRVSVQPPTGAGGSVIEQNGPSQGGTLPIQPFQAELFADGAILIATRGEISVTGKIRASTGVGFDSFEAPVHNRGARDKPDVLKIIVSKSMETGDAKSILPGGGLINLQEHPYRELLALGVSSSDVFRFAASRCAPNAIWIRKASPMETNRK